MGIWHKNNEKPMPYKMLVMEFDKPFGDQLPKEEQDAVYECYEMRYYGDGNGREWQALKQCNRWAYLDELVSDNEEKTAKIHDLSEEEKISKNTIHKLSEEKSKLEHENKETMSMFKHINEQYANSLITSQQRADCIDELKKQLSEHKEYCCCQKNEVLILENTKLKDILKECQIILQETKKDRGVYLNNLHLTDTLTEIEEILK